MQKGYSIYYNLGYWFILLLVLAFIGFYSSYLVVILQPTVQIIHIHFILMTSWMILLIVQPFLIKYKKMSLHRTLGKISYVMVPLVLLSGFLMIRFSYYRDINQLHQDAARGINHFTSDQIQGRVAASVALPFVWFTWFAIFYSLAIINRKKSNIHARYMLATALSLFGPIIDRITFKAEKFVENIRLESIAFLLADMILFILLWADYKNRLPTTTLRKALLIYVTGQLIYFAIPGTDAWHNFVALVMKPDK